MGLNRLLFHVEDANDRADIRGLRGFVNDGVVHSLVNSVWPDSFPEHRGFIGQVVQNIIGGGSFTPQQVKPVDFDLAQGFPFPPRRGLLLLSLLVVLLFQFGLLL